MLIEERFSNQLRFMLPEKCSNIILAVSGGGDSTALFHLMKNLPNVKVAHFNHKLRGKESDKEEDFVRELSDKFHIPFFSKAWVRNDKENNLQQSARYARYEFFNELCTDENSVVLTAHHRSDLLESILLNLDRGGNIGAYLGIRDLDQRENFTLLRPLLYFAKIDLLNFLKENNFDFCEDSSNLNLKYKRNQFRLLNIPEMKDRDSSLETIVWRKHFIVKRKQEKVTELINNLEDLNLLNKSILKTLDNDELFLFMREFLFLHAKKKDHYPVTKNSMTNLLKCIREDVSTSITMPQGIQISIKRNYIKIDRSA